MYPEYFITGVPAREILLGGGIFTVLRNTFQPIATNGLVLSLKIKPYLCTALFFAVDFAKLNIFLV